MVDYSAFDRLARDISDDESEASDADDMQYDAETGEYVSVAPTEERQVVPFVANVERGPPKLPSKATVLAAWRAQRGLPAAPPPPPPKFGPPPAPPPRWSGAASARAPRPPPPEETATPFDLPLPPAPPTPSAPTWPETDAGGALVDSLNRARTNPRAFADVVTRLGFAARADGVEGSAAVEACVLWLMRAKAVRPLRRAAGLDAAAAELAAEDAATPAELRAGGSCGALLVDLYGKRGAARATTEGSRARAERHGATEGGLCVDFVGRSAPSADAAVVRLLVADGDATRATRRRALDPAAAKCGAACSGAGGAFALVLAAKFALKAKTGPIAYKGRVPVEDEAFRAVLQTLPPAWVADLTARLRVGADVAIDYQTNRARVVVMDAAGKFDEFSVDLAKKEEKAPVAAAPAAAPAPAPAAALALAPRKAQFRKRPPGLK